MKSPLRRFLLACCLLTSSIAPSQADLLVGNANGTIARYRNDGSLVNPAFITGNLFPSAILVTGSNIYVARGFDNTVSKYNLDGSVVNASFITGLNSPAGLATDGTVLYVANFNAGTILRYVLDTGSALSALVTGLNGPTGLLYANGKLYVANFDAAKVSRYSLGGTLEAQISSGLNAPSYLALSSAGNLLVSDYGANKVGEYNLGTFAVVNASLIPSIQTPEGLLVSDGKLLVVSNDSGSVGAYTSSGGTLNAAFITGHDGPVGLAQLAENTPYPTPTVVISGKKKVTTSKASFTVKGKSTNATSVQVRVGKGKPKTAIGTASWHCKVKLKPGKNIVTITVHGGGGAITATKVTIRRE